MPEHLLVVQGELSSYQHSEMYVTKPLSRESAKHVLQCTLWSPVILVRRLSVCFASLDLLLGEK